MKPKTSADRLQYLDWVRGCGALIMLQGHVFDAFLKPEMRSGDAFMVSQFAGGMPPAIFLFLTGVTLSFLMDSSERKGMMPRDRVFTAFRRSGYLFFLAFAFRFQMWIFDRQGRWADLFKVDILNCMGMAIAVLSVMAVFRTSERVRWCAVVGLGIALVGPLVSAFDWSRVHWLVRDYIAPSKVVFGFFPWAAFLAFGMSVGSLIRTVPRDRMPHIMQWTALAGALLIVACQLASSSGFSLYRNSDYWLNSPAQVLLKQGVTLVMLGYAFLWTRYGAGPGWSWVRQVGTTSLLVYWVHIEVVYGRVLAFLKENLNVVETTAWAVGVILLMLALSAMRTNWRRIVSGLADTVGWYGVKPERVPGD